MRGGFAVRVAVARPKREGEGGEKVCFLRRIIRPPRARVKSPRGAHVPASRASPFPASFSHAPDRSWSLQTQRRRRTQRPRKPLCVKVGPFAGRELGWFWVSLLCHEPVLLHVFDRIAGLSGWTGSGSDWRRVAGCGARPRQNKPRTVRPGAAGFREANASVSAFRPGSVFLSNTSMAAA